MKKSILTKKMKERLKRVIVGAVMLLILIVLELCGVFKIAEDRLGYNNGKNIHLIVAMLVYFISGHYILKKALNNIKRGQWMDEIFLMAVASLGAFFLGEYHEAVAVVLFFEIGEFFQDYAVKKSKNSIAELMDVRPAHANIKTGDTYKKVSPSEIKSGDIIVILPGEKIPVDAVIVKGESSIDKRAMTGESIPEEVCAGSKLVSGCININGVLEARALTVYADSTVSRVLALMQSQSGKKAKAEEFISKFARYYTPAVIGLAALIAVIPPLLIDKGNFSEWIYSALTFLVISCPCALVLSVPLSFFGGIGGASSRGVLIKGAEYIEAISKLDTIIFDKTGTLTKGSFEVVNVQPDDIRDEILVLAASCEKYSTHPIAKSIVNAVGEKEHLKIENVSEISGCGIRAMYAGEDILVGNKKLMDDSSVKIAASDEENDIYTKIYVARNGRCIGTIYLADVIKDNAEKALQDLRKCGISDIIMLSGDKASVVNHVAAGLGIDKAYAELFPTDKVEITDRILKSQDGKRKTAFIGDGINDAPVIAGVDVGISFGGIGSDAAVEAADVVIMNDDLSKLPTMMKLAKRTMAIVKENIIFAISVKILVLILSACGVVSMWLAVIADVGVCLIAVLNALRTIYFKGKL